MNRFIRFYSSGPKAPVISSDYTATRSSINVTWASAVNSKQVCSFYYYLPWNIVIKLWTSHHQGKMALQTFQILEYLLSEVHASRRQRDKLRTLYRDTTNNVYDSVWYRSLPKLCHQGFFPQRFLDKYRCFTGSRNRNARNSIISKHHFLN